MSKKYAENGQKRATMFCLHILIVCSSIENLTVSLKSGSKYSLSEVKCLKYFCQTGDLVLGILFGPKQHSP